MANQQPDQARLNAAYAAYEEGRHPLDQPGESQNWNGSDTESGACDKPSKDMQVRADSSFSAEARNRPTPEDSGQ